MSVFEACKGFLLLRDTVSSALTGLKSERAGFVGKGFKKRGGMQATVSEECDFSNLPYLLSELFSVTSVPSKHPYDPPVYTTEQC